MKNFIKISTALLICLLVFTACNKDDETFSKEITAEELINYQIVDFFKAYSQNGEGDLMFVHYLKKENNTYSVYSSQYLSNFYISGNNILEYNPETGITKLNTVMGYYELSKNENNKIEVVGQFHLNDDPNNTAFGLTVDPSRSIPFIYKTTNETFFNKSYQSISHLNGIFRFSDLKFQFNSQREPTREELNLNYSRRTNSNWIGSKSNNDGTYTGYFFAIIPKNTVDTDWWGIRTEKNNLLVNEIIFRYNNNNTNIRTFTTPNSRVVCPEYD